MLALISCDQAKGEILHPEVPRYDAVIYGDLGIEPAWVPEQVKFIEAICRDSGIPSLYSEKRSLSGLHAKLWRELGFRYAVLDAE